MDRATDVASGRKGAKPKSRKSRSSSDILATSPRCIYCAAPATSVEHMPATALFRGRQRPSGLEFPCCERCNVGTRAADAFIAFLARLDRMSNVTDDWRLKEGLGLLRTASELVPGLRHEMFGEDKMRRALLRVGSGLLVPVMETKPGPLATALLSVWASKLAMALYHEHVGQPLPLHGGLQACWFLNNGPPKSTEDMLLSTMPVYGTLSQGTGKTVAGQFDYRYNCDDKTIFAAIVHFHGNIHFFVVATSEPDKYGFPREAGNLIYAQPGDLLRMMPKRPPQIFMPPS